MTAKEYISNSELLKKCWTNENRDLFLIDYEDLIKVLTDFATIKCKEQRENCAEEARIINLAWYNTLGYEWVVDKDSILTAKQPEV